MKHPVISVAMATYNGERFISEQLESFARQERLPDELVVCDDTSTDRTVEIVREFAKRAPFAVRVLVNKRNLGISKNFERAIAESTGEIIFLSDSDDYWYPQKILLMEKALDETPGAGLALCNSDCVGERLEPLGRTLWTTRYTENRKLLIDFAAGKTYRSSLPAGGCAMAFRARFKPLILPLPTDTSFMRGYHDTFIACTIICSGAGGAVLLPEPLLARRYHAGQATHTKNRTPFRRALVRLAARHESPGFLFAPILERVESDCAARYCLNPAIRRSAQRHWRTRLNLPPSFARRLPIVFRELASSRYHCFSGDSLSALKDLFFPRKPEEGTRHPANVSNEASARS